MVSALQIRNKLSEWIDRKISLREFEDWFVHETWDIHLSNDSEVEDLADDIEMNLSEYSGRHISQQQLYHSLSQLLPLGNVLRPFVQTATVEQPMLFGDWTSDTASVTKSWRVSQAAA
jgi:hypothetical protein